MSEQEEDALEALQRTVRFWEGAYRNERHKNDDLKRHLRDRDAHIANLEAQLRPYIGRQESVSDQPELL